jgi:ADP-ribose pyrophosphatase YjhB (NUDIX family)
MRALVQTGYAFRRRLLGWLRVRTRGVKVMLYDRDGRLLLIRNGYGDRDVFLLPGGGMKRHETPEAAAFREVREELNISVADLELVGAYKSSAEGKRDTIYLFRATALGTPEADSFEVEEARFVALDALPERVSPATIRRIREAKGELPTDGRW